MSAARRSTQRRDDLHEIDTIPPPPGEDFYRAPTKVTAVSQALAADMAVARERFSSHSLPPASGVVERRPRRSTPSLPHPSSLPHLFDAEDVAFEPTIRHAQYPNGPRTEPPPLILPPPPPVAQMTRMTIPLVLIMVLGVLALCTLAMGYTVVAVFL